MAAEGNSSACLKDRTCLPIGGHSVWAAIPPLPAAGSDPREDVLPVILIVANLDSTAFFQPEALVRPDLKPRPCTFCIAIFMHIRWKLCLQSHRCLVPPSPTVPVHELQANSNNNLLWPLNSSVETLCRVEPCCDLLPCPQPLNWWMSAS